jgi:hypothetical protein
VSAALSCTELNSKEPSMRRAAIVKPLRTPVGTFGGSLRPVPLEELAATVVRAVVGRSGVDPLRIDDVVFAQPIRTAKRRASAGGRRCRPGCRWKSPGCNSTAVAEGPCKRSSLQP